MVTKVDRLARSTIGLWDIVKRPEAVDDGGAGLRILNLGGEVVDARSATGWLMLTIFAGFRAVQAIMLERQREGIRKAQAAGKYIGRKPCASLKAGEVVAMVNSGKGAVTRTEFGRAQFGSPSSGSGRGGGSPRLDHPCASGKLALSSRWKSGPGRS